MRGREGIGMDLGKGCLQFCIKDQSAGDVSLADI